MAVKGVPVVISENGFGIPVNPVTENAPLLTIADNGEGAPIVFSDLGAPFIVDGGTPPVPPVPGPLDYIEDGQELSNITVEYDLARDVAMLGISFAYQGNVTGLTATHGGEPLELVEFVVNPDSYVGAACFIGNGLTVEPANLIITPVGGGTIGPALLRVDDSFAIDEVAVGASGGRYGYSNKQDGAPPVVFSPVSGNGWGVWALATASAEAESTAIAWNGAAPIQPLFWGVAASGTLIPVPAWIRTDAGWTEGVDGWWEHTGPSSYMTTADVPVVPMALPYWWEIEIEVDEGARLYVQVVGTNGLYTSTTYAGPFSGVVRGYRSQTAFSKAFQVQGLNGARFRNYKYCADGLTVYGQFGRSVNPVPDGSSFQFMMKTLSRFAGVAMEVHEA